MIYDEYHNQNYTFYDPDHAFCDPDEIDLFANSEYYRYLNKAIC